MSAMPKKTKLRFFLDNHILLSGLYSSENSPGKILEYFIEGRISVVISQQVLEKIVRVVKDTLPQALPALNTLLLNSPPEIITDPISAEARRWTKLVLKEDASILTAAISAQSGYFIIGDNHFLNNPHITKETGLHIIMAAQFVQLLD